jgi:hypothetical protein
MMILQSDKPLRAVGIHKLADLLPVERHSNRASLGGDLIRAPLTEWLGGKDARRRKLVHRPREMERIVESVGFTSGFVPVSSI